MTFASIDVLLHKLCFKGVTESYFAHFDCRLYTVEYIVPTSGIHRVPTITLNIHQRYLSSYLNCCRLLFADDLKINLPVNSFAYCVYLQECLTALHVIHYKD